LKIQQTLRPLSRILLAALAVAGIATTQGCKEDTLVHGNLNAIKTTTLNDVGTMLATTVIDDSVVTSLNINGIDVHHALGKAIDPTCGTVNGMIYMQVLPEKTNFVFSASEFILDSAFIVLPYSESGFSWGDTLPTAAPQQVRAYRVTEGMKTTDIYYSKSVKNVDRSNAISQTATIYPGSSKDSVSVLGTNRAPHLRLKLNDGFIQNLKDAAAAASTVQDFLDNINGIYLEGDTTSTTAKTLTYFRLNGSAEYQRAAVQFFFHDKNSTETKTAFFNFTSDCAHFNHVTRNYTGYPIASYIGNTNNPEVVFLQNEPGAAIDLKITNLKNLPTGIINRAEIVITQVSFPGDANAGTFFPPERIYPVGVDASGASYTVLDREPITDVAPLNFMDGKIKSVTLGTGITVHQYKLNLPREVQRAIVNKLDTLHLRINGTQSYPGAYRLIAGGSTGAYKIALNVTYSQL
jgi:hypothetical protein